MSQAKPDIRAIFCEALEKKSPEELAQYLDAACQGDAELRRRIEALLAADCDAGDFLRGAVSESDQSATSAHAESEPAGTIEQPEIDERAGSVIGPYKLLQKLGEGGMGAVYMAEQEHPVKRRVALKIIKAGMDSAQVIARFEQERQALAVMDHPNIAKVLDAGTIGTPLTPALSPKRGKGVKSRPPERGAVSN